MTYIEQAIQKAIEIEGGWKPWQGKRLTIIKVSPKRAWFRMQDHFSDVTCPISEILLDPLFWQSLGIGLGNKPEMRCGIPKCDYVQCEYAGYKDPKRMYDSFHETIWYGKDVESFFKELLTK